MSLTEMISACLLLGKDKTPRGYNFLTALKTQKRHRGRGKEDGERKPLNDKRAIEEQIEKYK